MFVEQKKEGEVAKVVPAHIAAILEHAEFMDKMETKNFDMTRFEHGCGHPACALGWAAHRLGVKVRFPYWDEFARRVFGERSYHQLFSNIQNGWIETPQQWAAHARKWVREQGF